MKRLLSLAAAASLVLGGICIVGCQPSSSPQQTGHNEMFGGGNGEFGTTTEIAGDYPRDVHHQPAKPEVSQSE